MNPKILVINPGSTSTKVSLFEGGNCLFTKSVFHDAPELLKYPTANDQVPMRRQVVESLLLEYGYTIKDVDVIAGRGGCAFSQPEGVMIIDKNLRDDTAKDAGGSDHAAKLGVLVAYELGTEYEKPMFTYNPTNIDELTPQARITGISGLYRRAQSHVLNQKAIARLHAKKNGLNYEDCNFIVCHIDGGITVAAHNKGRMLDGTEGAGGDGPFSPTRLGSIPVLEVVNYLDQGHTTKEIRTMCSRSGGFVSHFGTSDANKVHALVEKGDEKACQIWDTMVYQICKSIGAMATVLCGKVDAILLTGGLIRFSDITKQIKERCSWIAPVFEYEGEVEQEALADAVLNVLKGKESAKKYNGKPVFEGFQWE